MNKPLQNCPHCGGNLSLDDLRGTDCPFCHTALPHHAQAAEHAALVNQMLAQQGVNYQVPYQAGAPPPPVDMGPYAGGTNAVFNNAAAPVAMPPQVAHQVQQSMATANKAIATSVIVSVVIAALVGLIIVAMAAAMIIFAMV